MQAADLDMAELEPARGVAHPDLLSASRPMIIIEWNWVENINLWRLTATRCRILQDMVHRLRFPILALHCSPFHQLSQSAGPCNCVLARDMAREHLTTKNKSISFKGDSRKDGDYLPVPPAQ